MAERQQPLGSHAHTKRIVGNDRTQSNARQPTHDLDHGGVPLGHRCGLSDLGAHGRAEDEAGRAVLAHGLHDAPLT